MRYRPGDGDDADEGSEIAKGSNLELHH